MNKVFDDLLYQSGLIADGCWDELGTYEQEAIERLIQLTAITCADLCDSFQARDVGMQPAECAGAIRHIFEVEK